MAKSKPQKLSSNRFDGWFWQFVLVSIIHLFAVQFSADSLAVITKSVLIPALMIWYWQQSKTQLVWVYLALTASWVGDVLLTQDGLFYFIAGLLAFLLTHMVYAYFFLRQRGALKHWQVNLILILWSFLIVYGWYLSPHLEALKIPVYFYMVIITMMTSAAIARNRRHPGHGKVWQGTLFFMASDSLLAYDKFIAPIPGSHWWIMITYLVAQFLIVWGFLKDEDLQHEG